MGTIVSRRPRGRVNPRLGGAGQRKAAGSTAIQVCSARGHDPAVGVVQRRGGEASCGPRGRAPWPTTTCSSPITGQRVDPGGHPAEHHRAAPSRSPAQPPMQSSAAQVTGERGPRVVVDVGVEVLAGARVRRPGRGDPGRAVRARRPGRGRSAARRPRRGRCRTRSRWGRGACRSPAYDAMAARASAAGDRLDRRRAPRRRPRRAGRPRRPVDGGRRGAVGRRRRRAPGCRAAAAGAASTPIAGHEPASVLAGSRGDERGQRAGGPAAVAGDGGPAERGAGRSVVRSARSSPDPLPPVQRLAALLGVVDDRVGVARGAPRRARAGRRRRRSSGTHRRM